MTLFRSGDEIIFVVQPLTQLSSEKCKRCGFYEEDSFKSDDVFDEWEFCPSDFTSPDGKYTRFKDDEFNATFLCLDCVPFANSGCLFYFRSLKFLFLHLMLSLYTLCAMFSIL